MNDSVIGPFSIAAQNLPVPGCTISGQILPGVQCFSLAQGTDISAESYPALVLQYNLTGQTRLFDPDNKTEIVASAGDLVVKPANRNIGIIAEKDSVYLELAPGKEASMNQAVKAGEIFQLKDLVPYQDGKIVNMDIASNKNAGIPMDPFFLHPSNTGLVSLKRVNAFMKRTCSPISMY